MIKLWCSPGACSLAARILLNEVAAPFAAIATPVREGATQSEAFRAINPKARVPVLEFDGQIVTELPAILSLIATLSPDRHLMGATPMARARVLEWLNWLSGTLHSQGFGGLWRPQRFSDDVAAHDAIMRKGRTTIAEGYDFIEARLHDRFAVGDTLTAVDAFLLVLYRWGNLAGFGMTAHPRYSWLVDSLAERPSIITALADEGVTITGVA